MYRTGRGRGECPDVAGRVGPRVQPLSQPAGSQSTPGGLRGTRLLHGPKIDTHASIQLGISGRLIVGQHTGRSCAHPSESLIVRYLGAHLGARRHEGWKEVGHIIWKMECSPVMTRSSRGAWGAIISSVQSVSCYSSKWAAKYDNSYVFPRTLAQYPL